MSDTSYTIAGPVTVTNKDGVIETKACYTRKELRSIVNKDLVHKNSLSMLIKHDTVMLAKFRKNRAQYLENYETYQIQTKNRYVPVSEGVD